MTTGKGSRTGEVVADSGEAGGTGAASAQSGGSISGGRIARIPVYESSPENIKLHIIEDHELEMLMNISRPVALGISCTMLGASLGLLPSVFGIIALVGKQKVVSLLDVVTVVICGVCFAIFIVTGLYAWQGQRRARKILAEIRARPLSPV